MEHPRSTQASGCPLSPPTVGEKHSHVEQAITLEIVGVERVNEAASFFSPREFSCVPQLFQLNLICGTQTGEHWLCWLVYKLDIFPKSSELNTSHM